MELAAQLYPTRGTLPELETCMRGSLQSLLDYVNGGAWPFTVRVLRCLLYCDNERDLYWLLPVFIPSNGGGQFFGSTETCAVMRRKMKAKTGL